MAIRNGCVSEGYSLTDTSTGNSLPSVRFANRRSDVGNALNEHGLPTRNESRFLPTRKFRSEESRFAIAMLQESMIPSSLKVMIPSLAFATIVSLRHAPESRFVAVDQ